MSYSAQDIAGMDYVRLCPFCDGAGQYEQTYTVGCGGGYYRAMGSCGHCSPEPGCDGVGILNVVTGKAVTASVIAQIDARKALAQSNTLGETS